MSSFVNSAQYKDWLYNIARNMRNTYVTPKEDIALRDFLKLFWDPKERRGYRPWLDYAFQEKAVSHKSENNYQGIIDEEPTHVIIEMLEVLARDLVGPEIQNNDELNAIQDLMIVTGNRMYGGKLYYGGSAGSLIGLHGLQGLQGFQGSQGFQGLQGLQGPQDWPA